jgi:hypothetical protein
LAVSTGELAAVIGQHRLIRVGGRDVFQRWPARVALSTVLRRQVGQYLRADSDLSID